MSFSTLTRSPSARRCARGAELHGRLAADEHVAVGDEVVLLDGRPGWDGELLYRTASLSDTPRELSPSV